jgi:hypothetical protein
MIGSLQLQYNRGRQAVITYVRCLSFDGFSLTTSLPLATNCMWWRKAECAWNRILTSSFSPSSIDIITVRTLRFLRNPALTSPMLPGCLRSVSVNRRKIIKLDPGTQEGDLRTERRTNGKDGRRDVVGICMDCGLGKGQCDENEMEWHGIEMADLVDASEPRQMTVETGESRSFSQRGELPGVPPSPRTILERMVERVS